MSGFAVGLTVVGVTAVILGLVVLVCHYMGLWTWTTNWLFSSHEEKAQLTKSEHFNVNGYMVGSDSDFTLDTRTGNYRRYDNVESDFRFLDETKKEEIPPQPLRPAPIAPQPQLSSENLALEKEGPCLEIVEVEDLSPNLKRAMSCDSVSSDTSVALETLEEVQSTGKLEVGLEYDRESADLIVMVIQARELIGPEPSSSVDSYIRVFLLPDKSSNMQTRIQKWTNDPVYKERFLFGVEPTDFDKRALMFYAYTCNKYSHTFVVKDIQTLGCHAYIPEPTDFDKRALMFYAYTCNKYSHTLIGEAELKLTELDLSHATTLWLNLADSNQQNNDLGEIMFSLSYLPTAERLTVVVVKARNLRWTHNKETADPFVKVYLLQNGKKISKKKTSVKKDERNPIFNEAMIFSVPATALQTVQLRVSMAEYQADGRTPSIGHVIVGSQATGKTLSHWNQMMSSLRKPIAMWHPLRK